MGDWSNVKNAFGFKPVARLALNDDGCLQWHPESDIIEVEETPSTYVMVLNPGLDDELETVLYVGMAGKGWAVRAKQHNGGLKRTHNGTETKTIWLEHFAKRKAWLQENRQIMVFERASQTYEVFGQQVSLQHAEEQALIKMLNPSQNRAGVSKV